MMAQQMIVNRTRKTLKDTSMSLLLIKENQDAAASRNVGLANMTGVYLCF